VARMRQRAIRRQIYGTGYETACGRGSSQCAKHSAPKVPQPLPLPIAEPLVAPGISTLKARTDATDGAPKILQYSQLSIVVPRRTWNIRSKSPNRRLRWPCKCSAASEAAHFASFKSLAMRHTEIKQYTSGLGGSKITFLWHCM
jgi:hypothetical protein